MWIRTTWRALARHPLNKGQRIRAFRDWFTWQVSSHLAPGPVSVPFVNGSRMLVRPGMHAATANIYCGLYEFEDMAFVGHALRPGDLFVDVGANVGTYTILAASVGARPLSLEPVPSTYHDLQANVRHNGMESRVDRRNVGAGRASSRLRFTQNLGSMNRVAGAGEEGLEVAVEPLDSLLAGSAARVIKIDVEGFEAEVLAGAGATLASPGLLGLIIERGVADDEVRRTMMTAGFSMCAYDPLHRRLTVLEAVPTTPNILYVRDVLLAQSLVASAPPLKVHRKSV